MYRLFLVLIGAFVLFSCDGPKEITTTEPDPHSRPPVNSREQADPEDPELANVFPDTYNPSATRDFDLIHTRLEVSFDWQNQFLMGEAELTLEPYFYPQTELTLDAKGFIINEISLMKGKTKTPLKYWYPDSMQVDITLDREYKKGEKIKIFIDYVARPNLLEAGGSHAITSDKGLYFINPLKEEPNKPQQIWTQGETESSSCWFPTIDKPNERCTQEIYITVEDRFTTLSNGTMISSKKNTNGTRTDYWKQDQPHAPYLFMMAIGEFAVVKDKWKNMDVWYYVEPDYEQYALDIFGNTPAMLTFYTELLGVDYPWDKYHQVIVRDFVSGAMENTTAVIHYAGLNQTRREMLDGDHEDIIAHELIHHWFGDLVTCESWANLPLNESFATYGEALWIEHFYGQEFGDYHCEQDLSRYMSESRSKQVDMIRFDYLDKEHMFDSHSYAKGGLILRMLRHYLGDDAFFAGLRKYLLDNEYTDVEIHELRLAMEDVCGEDLNWFFNQWFMASGHPTLQIEYKQDGKNTLVFIKQTQDLTTTPLYKLPIQIDIYKDGKVTSEEVVLEAKIQMFEFETNGTPDLVNVDAKKSLLCEKVDKKPLDWYIFQYRNAPLYMDRKEALEYLIDYQDNEQARKTIKDAFDDKFWALREFAIANFEIRSERDEELHETLKQIALNDEKSHVRDEAYVLLSKLRTDGRLEVFENGLSDSSYMVMSTCLDAIHEIDEKKGYEAALKLKDVEQSSITTSVALIFSTDGGPEVNDYYMNKVETAKGFSRYYILIFYGRYLGRMIDEDFVADAIPLLGKVAREDAIDWNQSAALGALEEIVSGINAELDRILGESDTDLLSRQKAEKLKKVRDLAEAEMKKGE